MQTFKKVRVRARGGTNRAFGKPCFCPLPKMGRFDENGEDDEFAFYPLKRRASLLRPPKTTKMTIGTSCIRYTHLLSGQKNNINIIKLLGPDFLWTFLTLTPGCPGVIDKKFLPVSGGRRKTHFSVRMSTIFGADVHDPKGSRKTLYKKSLR